MNQFPAKILYPKEFFPVKNELYQAILEDYVSVLEKHMNTTRIEFSIVERWSQCPPDAAKGQSFREFLCQVGLLCLVFIYLSHTPICHQPRVGPRGGATTYYRKRRTENPKTYRSRDEKPLHPTTTTRRLHVVSPSPRSSKLHITSA